MAGKIKSGKYAVPKEISSLKPKEIRCDIKVVPTKTKTGYRMHYYVYEVIDNKAGTTIGKIEGGKFCPNARGLERLVQIHNESIDDVQYLNSEPEPESVNTSALSDDESKNIELVAANMNLSLKNIDLQIKDYGEYAAVLACSQSVLERLEQCFSDQDARLIYALSIIYFVQEYTPASYVKDVYDQSILSNKWPTLAISENTVGEFLKLLGRHPLVCERYSQSLINCSSGMIAIDGHVVLTCSRLNDLADYGHKYHKIGNKQMNVLQAYDALNEVPLTSKTYEGDVVDMSSVKDLFETYDFPSGTTFLIDAGFYSEENFSLYRRNGNHFVIPVTDSAIISKAIRLSATYECSFSYVKQNENGVTYVDTILCRESTVRELEDLYQKQLDEDTERKNQEELKSCQPGEKPKKHHSRKVSHSKYGNDRVIIYRDEEMHNKMVSEYLSQIGTDDAHTEEKLSQLAPQFGVIVLRTNIDLKSASASVVYHDYKRRWKIETHYNFVANAIRFCGLQESDYYSMEGLSFLMITVGQIKNAFLKKMRSSKERYVRNMSIAEVIAKAGRVKVSQHQDKQWYFSCTSKKKALLMKELGVDIGGDLRKLNISQL